MFHETGEIWDDMSLAEIIRSSKNSQLNKTIKVVQVNLNHSECTSDNMTIFLFEKDIDQIAGNLYHSIHDSIQEQGDIATVYETKLCNG